jgi:hypothetical protein
MVTVTPFCKDVVKQFESDLYKSFQEAAPLLILEFHTTRFGKESFVKGSSALHIRSNCKSMQ